MKMESTNEYKEHSSRMKGNKRDGNKAAPLMAVGFGTGENGSDITTRS